MYFLHVQYISYKKKKRIPIAKLRPEPRSLDSHIVAF